MHFLLNYVLLITFAKNKNQQVGNSIGNSRNFINNFAKSLWTIVYDSVTLKVVKNVENIEKKIGFFYIKYNEKNYVWRYDKKRGYKSQPEGRTELKLIYKTFDDDFDVNEIISTHSKTSG